MRISFSLGSALSIQQIMQCSEHLSKYTPDTVWIPETWGMENFSVLSGVSHRVSSKIGSSIINIYSRSPALVAMGAATLDTISDKKMVLGLGASSMNIVQDFHGYSFIDPVNRMREYVDIINTVISKKKISHDGKYFKLKNFTLLIDPPRKKIPIYLAAVNKKMVDLAWEVGDGVIFYLRPLGELKRVISEHQSKRDIDTSCQVITAVSFDAQKAITRAKKTLAFYISVGKIYREFLAKNGYQKETKEIFDEYQKTNLATNYNLIPEKMLYDLTICGTPDDIINQLKKFQDAGVKQPIIQFNPVGDTVESFELLTKTFSDVI